MPEVPDAAAAPGTGAGLVCVCGVTATGRCVRCDTAVCDAHRDGIWHGDPDRPEPGDAVERALWRVTAERMRLPDAMCARCRSQNAWSWLRWYRAELGARSGLGVVDRLLAIEAAVVTGDAGDASIAMIDALGEELGP